MFIGNRAIQYFGGKHEQVHPDPGHPALVCRSRGRTGPEGLHGHRRELPRPKQHPLEWASQGRRVRCDEVRRPRLFLQRPSGTDRLPPEERSQFVPVCGQYQSVHQQQVTCRRCGELLESSAG